MTTEKKALTRELKIERVLEFIDKLQDHVAGRRSFSFNRFIKGCHITWNTQALAIRRLMLENKLIQVSGGRQNAQFYQFTEAGQEMKAREIATQLVALIDYGKAITLPTVLNDLDAEVEENIDLSGHKIGGVLIGAQINARINGVTGEPEEEPPGIFPVNHEYGVDPFMGAADVKFRSGKSFDARIDQLEKELNNGKENPVMPGLLKYGPQGLEPYMIPHDTFIYRKGRLYVCNDITLFLIATTLERVAMDQNEAASVRKTAETVALGLNNLINDED